MRDFLLDRVSQWRDLLVGQFLLEVMVVKMICYSKKDHGISHKVIVMYFNSPEKEACV